MKVGETKLAGVVFGTVKSSATRDQRNWTIPSLAIDGNPVAMV